MSLNLSNLTEYVDQELIPLITKALLEGRTLSYIDLQAGVKHKATLNYFDTDAVFRAGNDCSFVGAGTTSVEQKEIEVVQLNMNEEICPNEMEQYFLSKQMRPGVNQEDLTPIEEVYMSEKMAKINEQIEILTWSGDTSGSTGTNLDLVDGLLKKSDDDAVPFVQAGTGALIDSNIIDSVDAVINAIPSDILDRDVIVFLGYDKFNLYISQQVKANLFHYSADNANYEYVLPGRANVKLVAVKGLNGKDELFCTYADNLVMVTDLASDAETIDMWYSKDDRVVKSIVAFKMGTAIRYNDFVVRHTA